MHGRKRESAEQSAERKAALSQKARRRGSALSPRHPALTASAPAQAALYAKLQAGVLARRAAGAHDGATLELSAKLLEPWNSTFSLS